jgi:hypothetical protein
MGATIHLRFDTYTSGGQTSLAALNSTGNCCALAGSGMAILRQFRLSMRFSTFSVNGPLNCLAFDENIQFSNISCAGLFNNSCTSSSRYPGLIYVMSDVALRCCLFVGNRFDYFLGAGYGSWSIKLINSVLDFEGINKTNGVMVETSRGTLQQDAAALGCCRRPDASATVGESRAAVAGNESVAASQTGTAPGTRSWSTPSPSPGDRHRTLSPGAIAGIVVGAVLVIGGGAALAVWFELRQRNYENMKEGLISANSCTYEIPRP